MEFAVGFAFTDPPVVELRFVPGDQVKAAGPLALRATDPPLQIVALDTLIAGGVVTVTLTVAVTLLHPAVIPVIV